MQNKNVVLPNTNVNPVEPQAENPVLDATEINITGKGRNAADLPSAGGVPPEAKIENDSVKFHSDDSSINGSISQTGSGFFWGKSTSDFSASSESGVNKENGSVVNDSMFGTKSSFLGSGSRRFFTSSESTLNGTLPRSKSVASFGSSSGSDSDIFGKRSKDDSSIHTGSSKFNISSTTDSIAGDSMKISQSSPGFNLMVSKEDSNLPKKILTDSTESLNNSTNSSTNSSVGAKNFDSTGSFTGSAFNVQNPEDADLVIVQDGNIRYAYYEDPNEHVYEFDETTGTLTIFKDFADGETAYFDDWDNFTKDIKKVVIRDGVTSIDKDAFSGCSKLTEITIPATVTSIGNNAFTDCSNLTEITIPGKVTSIGASAFSGCSKLTKITIPATVTSIGNNAFTDCSNLTEITIPGKVTSIGTAAFLNCSKLTKIAIPASVTSIGADAFNGCSSLTEIAIPASVASIGAYAFANCSALKNVSFEGKDSPNYGGYLIFCDCPDDLVINVPENYDGDEFCGLNVIKGAQPQVKTEASTNVGHMDEEDVSSQPGLIRRIVNGAVNAFTAVKNMFNESDSSVDKELLDLGNDDTKDFFADSFFEDKGSQSEMDKRPQTHQSSSTREIEVENGENIVYTYMPFSRFIPATKQVDELHDFLSKLQVDMEYGLPDISTVSQESLKGLKDDISYLANQVKLKPDDGSYTLNALLFTTNYKKDNQAEFTKISQIVLLNEKINGKLKNLIDKVESLQDSENTNNFDSNNNGEENESWFEYISKNKGKVLEYGLVGLGAAYLAYRFGPEIAASACAALGLGGGPTSPAKGSPAQSTSYNILNNFQGEWIPGDDVSTTTQKGLNIPRGMPPVYDEFTNIDRSKATNAGEIQLQNATNIEITPNTYNPPANGSGAIQAVAPQNKTNIPNPNVPITQGGGMGLQAGAQNEVHFTPNTYNPPANGSGAMQAVAPQNKINIPNPNVPITQGGGMGLQAGAQNEVHFTPNTYNPLANGSGAIQAVAPQNKTNIPNPNVPITQGGGMGLQAGAQNEVHFTPNTYNPPANGSGAMQGVKLQNTSTSVIDPSGKLPTNVPITRNAGMSPDEVSKVFLQNQDGKVERQRVENPQNPANAAFATAQNSPITPGTEGWSQENFIRRVPADGSAIKTPSTEQNSPITPKSTAVVDPDYG